MWLGILMTPAHAESPAPFIAFEIQATTIPADHQVTDVVNDLQQGLLTFNHFQAADEFNFTEQHSLLLKIQKIPNGENPTNESLLIFPGQYDFIEYFATTSPVAASQGKPNTFTTALTLKDQSEFALTIPANAANHTHYVMLQSAQSTPVHLSWLNPMAVMSDWNHALQWLYLIGGLLLAWVFIHLCYFLLQNNTAHGWLSMTTLMVLISLVVAAEIVAGLAAPRAPYVILTWTLADLMSIRLTWLLLRLSWLNDWLMKGIKAVNVLRLLLGALLMVTLHGWVPMPTLELVMALKALLLTSAGLLLWAITKQIANNNPPAIHLLAASLLWTMASLVVVIPGWFDYLPAVWHPHAMGVVVFLWAMLTTVAIPLQKATRRQAARPKIKSKRAVNRTEFQQHLITQFQDEMDDLVNNPTLSPAEVVEKTNIKMHLLINRAFPVMNSIIFEDDELHGICTTGLTPKNLETIVDHINNIPEEDKQQISSFKLTDDNGLEKNMLFVPLQTDNESNTQMVFGLQPNKSINEGLMKEFKTHCEAAYSVLSHAKIMHQDALDIHFDALTQCHNKNSIETIVAESLAHCSRTTIAYMSLDNLNKVKQQQGVAVVDQCLIQFANIMNNALMNYAKMGRIDELTFVAVFADIDFNECEELMELWLNHFTENPVTNHQITLNFSCGMAESRINETQESLMDKAAQAHAEAKRQGHHHLHIYHTSSVNEQAG